MSDSTPPANNSEDQDHQPPPDEGAMLEPEDNVPVRAGASSSDDPLDAPAAEEQPWFPLFPFDEPYPQQVTGINEFLDSLADNGYYAIEGACGTGKTLIGLVGALHAMDSASITHEDTTKPLPEYERAVAVTPVKQQLKQFITEVRAINRNLPPESDYASANALVLRGLTDMLAYTNADDFDFGTKAARALARADSDDRDVEAFSGRDQISQIRTTTRELIKAGSQIQLSWEVTKPDTCSASDCRHLVGNPQMDVCPFHSDAPPDEDPPWADIVRAERVVELVEDLAGDRLTVNGIETPYPDRLPIVSDLVKYDTQTGSTHAKAPFDPFYAKAMAGLASVDFSAGAANVLDRERLVSAAAADGSCPHVLMGNLAGRADIVIGNYNHLFDPQTRQLTAGKADLFDEETILIVDEAHRVEDRVRDLLSDDLSPYALLRVRQDLGTALHIVNGNVQADEDGHQQTAAQTARGILTDADDSRTLTTDDLERGIEFTEWLIDAIGDLVTDHLESEYRHWKAAIGDGSPSSDSFNLEDTEQPGKPDDLTQRLTQSDSFNPDYLMQFPTVCEAAAAIHSEVDLSERETICSDVGEMLGRWRTADSVTHHREVVIEHSPHRDPPDQLPDWVEHITARLHLFNTIPSDRVAAIYDEVGGGIVMSATLAPLEDYTETAGLAPLEDSSENEIAGTPPAGAMVTKSELGARPITTNTYDLAFPEENRASWIVNTPPYTKRNRGSPTQNWKQMTPARQKYASALAEIGTSYGNHLVAMPNYQEAQWAGNWLRSKLDKPVYIDESSSAADTTEMLESFFADEHAVFITSSLGTVTEGIDYDGEKLHCTTVVGVPYRNIATGRAQAVIEAYDREIANGNQSGFDTAVGIPAVRKARQAIGRVLRAPHEHGVRIFLDERYGKTGKYNVGQYLSSAEYDEFQRVQPDMLSFGFDQFWEDNRKYTEGDESSTDATNGSPSAKTESTATNTDDTPQISAGDLAEDTDLQSDADSNPNATTSEDSTQSTSSETDYSKMYFGKEASLSAWIPIETAVAENEIIPLVKQHTIDTDTETATETIKLNFSKGLSLSGWTAVEADVVTEEIEPIARRARK